MTYRLLFDDIALKEWKSLSPSIQSQFAEKLKERCDNPRVPASKLSGMKDCYKIKLSSAGYRLVYRVVDNEIQIIVIAVGKREKSKVYKDASKRL
jgi:mRNA interferase RelE/StbE